MLAETSPPRDPFGCPLDVDDDECEFCGRSMIPRFPGVVQGNECAACQDTMNLLHRAGKLRMDGWSMVTVKIGED